MFGINTSVGGGIYRTSNNMNRANTLLQKSLERLETGNKINRASDDPTAYGKGLSITAEINALNTQIEANKDTLVELDKLEVAVTSILDSYQEMKTAAQDYSQAVTDGDVASEAAHRGTIVALQDAINSFAAVDFDGNSVLSAADAATPTIQWGTETSEIFTQNWLDLETTAATGDVDGMITALPAVGAGTTAAATNLIAQIDISVGRATQISSAIAAIKENTVGAAQLQLNAELSALTDMRNSVLSVNEGEESAKITGLQMRQQAMVSSLGMQNAFTASTLDLLG
ncbi:MAG: flagellin [Planctomycetota bacterium]|jgi:flagellin